MEQVLEMEQMEQMEMEGNEFEENSNTETVAVNTVATPHVNKIGQQTVVAFVAGLSTGLAVGVALWFNERNKRLAILEQLELATTAASGIYKGDSKATFKKRFHFKESEIDLTEIVMKNPSTYTATILENITKVRFMRKSEKERWQTVLKDIVTLSIAWYEEGLKNDTIGKEIPEDETTEVLKESK